MNAIYIPILKLKKSEMGALAELSSKDKELLMPVIRLVPHDHTENKVKVHDTNEVIFDSFVTSIENLLPTMNFYVDPTILFPNSTELFVRKFLEVSSIHSRVLPIISYEEFMSMEVSADLANFISKYGIGLKVSVNEQLSEKIEGLIEVAKSKVGDIGKVHLMIDVGIVDKSKRELLNSLFSNSKLISGWAKIFLSVGAFPKDLSNLKNAGKHLLPRNEWEIWNSFHAYCHELVYSDYTIQHPEYFELPPVSYPSYSVKYTVAENYVVYKGYARNSRNIGQGFDPAKQYVANAMLLVKGNEHFCGRDFSSGDQFIFSKAGEGIMSKTPGGHGQWLKASINHHLVFMIRTLEKIVE